MASDAVRRAAGHRHEGDAGEDEDAADGESSFYTRDNLPPDTCDSTTTTDDAAREDGSWMRRMVYRLFLRSPYPPARLLMVPSGLDGKELTVTVALRFGLVNEMSLYPRGAVPQDVRVPCDVTAVDARGRQLRWLDVAVSAAKRSPQAHEGDVTPAWPGLDGGKGACKVTARTKADCTIDGKDSIWLHISILPSTVAHLHVMPLVVGPIALTTSPAEAQLTGDELLYFYRPLCLPAAVQSVTEEDAAALMIQEQPELAIPGKIWDSALFAAQAALDLLAVDIQEHAKSAAAHTPLHVLDLSSGTGVCGIWLAAALSHGGLLRERGLRLTLTDLDDSLGVMRRNADGAAHLWAADDVTVDVRRVRWGERSDLDSRSRPELASRHQTCDSADTDLTADGIGADLVLACDLVYEPQYLDALARTFVDLCCPANIETSADSTQGGCRVLIGYKRRGLSQMEKQTLWQRFALCFESVEQIDSQRVSSSMIDSAPTAKHCGIELWLLSRPRSRAEALAALDNASPLEPDLG